MLFDSQSHHTFFAFCNNRSQHIFSPSVRSEKKTKVKVVGSVTPSARATPASDESTDFYELGAEAEEVDTAAEDADATDNQTPRYAELEYPADRYGFFPSTYDRRSR